MNNDSDLKEARPSRRFVRFRRRLKRIFRRLTINLIFRYKQGKELNIVVFANRRGGSTLLAEAININPGIWFVDEPFAYIEGHNSNTPQQRKFLKPKPNSIYLSVEKNEEAGIKHYVDGLLNAKLRQNGLLRRPKKLLVADRSLLKILNAGPLIEWIVNNFDVLPIHFLRHPGAQALSVYRCGWEWSTPAFMQNPSFVQRFLTKEHLCLIHQIENTGGIVERGVLNWVLENLAQLQYSGKILRISYEDLIANTEMTIDALAEYLNLDSKETMKLQVLGRPSGSSGTSTKETIAAIKNKDYSSIISSWQNEIDEGDLHASQRILDAFEIDCYKMQSPYSCNSNFWSLNFDRG